MKSIAWPFVVSLVLASGGCSSFTEPLTHLEPMDRKLGEIDGRIAELHAIQAELASVNSNLGLLDRKLGGLAAIDAGIARTQAGVSDLHAMLPGLERVQQALGRVAGNDELLRVDARLGQQLEALGVVKDELKTLNERLSSLKALGDLSSELKGVNEKLAGLSTLATEMGGDARTVLGWKPVVVAVVFVFAALFVLLHLRLQSLVRRSSPPGGL
jgi:hypothetical protein